MRIVIDMQVAQIEGELLGAGRYATAFAQAIVRNRGQHEVFLALSGLAPRTIEPIRAAFDGLLAQENIRVWYAPCNANPSNAAERNIAALLKEAFIASLNPDIVHIFALDEEHVDSELVSIYRFEKNTPVTIALDADTAIFPPRNNKDSESNHLWILFSEVDSFESNLDSDIKKSVIATLKPSLTKDGQIRLDHPHSESIFRIINTWEKLASAAKNIEKPAHTRKTLAFVSPMPPERTGIADYSAELLPALNKYYDIILIVEQDKLDPTFRKKFRVEDSRWLVNNKHLVDRVLYQVGNAPYHQHMLDLVKEIPGTVVLHDFFLGHLRHWKEVYVREHEWHQSLYDSHGYQALIDAQNDIESAKLKYPVNWDLIKNTNGLIFHSEFSRNLLNKWYTLQKNINFHLIPHLRNSSKPKNISKSRKKLKIENNDFVICSFGFLGESKQNHRLLESWVKSSLSSDPRCQLIFVGELPKCEYGNNLLKAIASSGISERIKITGFASQDLYKDYLCAADVAVQLRNNSRGETSGTVLDCMNYQLPLIVNSNGSMAELNESAAWILPDNFSDADLISALEEIWNNQILRVQMGKNAKEIIETEHTPEKCAKKYAMAIEEDYLKSRYSLSNLVRKIVLNSDTAKLQLPILAQVLDKNFPEPKPAKRLFIDITATCTNDLKTGIERVARALTIELIKNSSNSYRVEPVYLSKINNQWNYIYARKYTTKLLGISAEFLDDEIVEFSHGDIVLGLDISGQALVESVQKDYIKHLRNRGVFFHFMVHDLIPVKIPSVFPPGADEGHSKWLNAVAQTDGVIGVTEHIANEFKKWLEENKIQHQRRFDIRFSHHGADLENSAPSKGIPYEGKELLKTLLKNPSFLMVGTIEPRKGYEFTLNAFEKLWTSGSCINLVIVGNEGWIGLPENNRRDIPQTIKRLRNHPENGNRLFFLEGISDEYLNNLYANSTCLIAASYDEGFGLPLIEAAQHGLPIIARDIPVFREVAGDGAYYFNGNAPELLSESIKSWLHLYNLKKHPNSNKIPWITWKKSANKLIKIIENSH